MAIQLYGLHRNLPCHEEVEIPRHQLGIETSYSPLPLRQHHTTQCATPSHMSVTDMSQTYACYAKRMNTSQIEIAHRMCDTTFECDRSIASSLHFIHNQRHNQNPEQEITNLNTTRPTPNESTLTCLSKLHLLTRQRQFRWHLKNQHLRHIRRDPRDMNDATRTHASHRRCAMNWPNAQWAKERNAR